MKKCIHYIVAFFLIFSFVVPSTYAATSQVTSDVEIISLKNGNQLKIITTVSATSRGTVIVASKQFVYENLLGHKFFSYTLMGRFEYNGSTSKAIDVTSHATIYDSDWTCVSHRESYSGNTVYGSATFGGPYIETIGGSISCDKNGNIS